MDAIRITSVRSKCVSCPYSAESTAEMEDHKKRFHSFKCPHDCGYVAKTERCLTLHLNRKFPCYKKTAPVRYNCSKCKFVTASEALFKAHTRCLKRDVYNCQGCRFITRKKKRFENHLNKCESAPKYYCSFCTHISLTLEASIEHAKHSNCNLKIEFFCPLCEFECVGLAPLEAHFMPAHGTLEEEVVEKVATEEEKKKWRQKRRRKFQDFWLAKGAPTPTTAIKVSSICVSENDAAVAAAALAFSLPTVPP